MKKLLSIKEVAVILNTTVGTLYQWKHHGKIPYVKINGKLLFKEEEIAALMN